MLGAAGRQAVTAHNRDLQGGVFNLAGTSCIAKVWYLGLLGHACGTPA
jgi:hypothetical protein